MTVAIDHITQETLSKGEARHSSFTSAILTFISVMKGNLKEVQTSLDHLNVLEKEMGNEKKELDKLNDLQLGGAGASGKEGAYIALQDQIMKVNNDAGQSQQETEEVMELHVQNPITALLTLGQIGSGLIEKFVQYAHSK